MKKGKKVENVCENCKESYFYYPCRTKTGVSRYCSSECKNEGYKHSNEVKAKVSQAGMGRKPWNKGKKCPELGKSWRGKSLPDYLKKRLSKIKTGKPNLALRGRKRPEFSERLRQWNLAHAGDKSPSWKGGISNKNELFRKSYAYKKWRTSVFERDEYTCILCGHNDKSRKTINADHIKPFSKFPELRLEVSNGRTLCVPCHRTTDTWGARANK